MRPESRRFVVVLVIAAVTVTAGALVLAIKCKDGEWVNRGGSCVAALAAAAIFFQVTRELELERAKVRLMKGENASEPLESRPSPIAAAAARMIRHEELRLSRERLTLVGWVSAIACIGELIHGFGSWLFMLTTGI